MQRYFQPYLALSAAVDMNKSKIKKHHQEGRKDHNDSSRTGSIVKEVKHKAETAVQDTSKLPKKNISHGSSPHGPLNKSVYMPPSPRQSKKKTTRKKPVIDDSAGCELLEVTAATEQPIVMDTPPSVPATAFSVSTEHCKERKLGNIPAIIVSSSQELNYFRTNDQELDYSSNINDEKATNKCHESHNMSLEGPHDIFTLQPPYTNTVSAGGGEDMSSCNVELAIIDHHSSSSDHGNTPVNDGDTEQNLQQDNGRSSVSKIVGVAMMAKQWKNRFKEHHCTAESGEELLRDTEAQEKLEQALPKNEIMKVKQEALIVLTKTENMYRSYLGREHVLTKKVTEHIQHLQGEVMPQ